MFQTIQETFRKTFEKLSGRGRLSEADIDDASRDIKLSLLAADVHFAVVKDFIDAVKAKAIGKKVLDSITPAQQFTKIVHDELVRVLGQEAVPFDFACTPPLVVLIVGLQGSGKTTTAARFALYCKNKGRRPVLVPADVHRPAAIEQLKILGLEAGVDCFQTEQGIAAVKVVSLAVKKAQEIGYDTIIIDTAGRLHVDKEMMDEAKEIADQTKPQRILYVADAMTGQDAVKSAKAFNDILPITGVILSKLDGDQRGGAALSVRAVTGKPIIFAGTGEKLEDMEVFHPDRMASRILGMGDVVSLVERVAGEIKEKDAKELETAFLSKRFTFNDFLTQVKMMKRLGPMDKILGMMPGMGSVVKDLNPQDLEREFKKKEAIVSSMTLEERAKPLILNGSRRKRIAFGAGVHVSDVNRFLKEFEAMGKMIGRLKGGGMIKKLFKGLTL